MSVFHAYDIRGVYGKNLDENFVYDVAHAFVKHTNAKRVVIGHDMRLSSPCLYRSLMKGLLEAGCHVISIDLCTTPMLYYMIGRHKLDGGIMVTASHNPSEYNGLKLCREMAKPIGMGSGLEEIERLVNEKTRVISRRGALDLVDPTMEYRLFMKEILKDTIDNLKVVVDCGNGMGIMDLEHLKELCGRNIRWSGLYTDYDGKFPNHQPNPMEPRCMQALIRQVKEEQADIGIAFDGDSDRIGFVDEEGNIVEADMMFGLLVQEVLRKHPGEHFLYDLRSSNVVSEEITRLGGTASMCRVGHGYIKHQMREENAILGAELSCHFYWRDVYYTDNALLCALWALAALSNTGKKLSELIAPFRVYSRSGEINNKVKNADAVLSKIEKEFAGGEVNYLDGIRIDHPHYWINVRKSNTEPLVRLLVEAKDPETMQKIRDQALAVIQMEA